MEFAPFSVTLANADEVDEQGESRPLDYFKR